MPSPAPAAARTATSATTIAVEAVGLTFPSKSGEPTVALGEVSCRFAPGKVTAIIGPSGCGKSTLLQIVRGFLAPTRGTLRFLLLGGDGATDAAATPRDVAAPHMATVWQAFNLFPWRTVIDNVAFGLEVAGVPKAERLARARKALAAVDLGGFEQKYPRQLSGGMRQRVGIARALVMEPEVLLLDEPFGALDAQTRLVLQEQLATLVERSGTTAILVTHSIEEAILLADTILVMTARPGRIAAEIHDDLPHPRSMATTHDPRFAALFDRIYGLLRQEVIRAMATEGGDA
ncbi:ABC transporter ATP-binding protein [Rhodoplanes sp. TEM]|uniref:ABC transporter ATP-binding protein n=1 Tax=Rhodoplanes tepidamans TaxID=200616 RepID=A0ABT5J8X0_RHOTP|nr:MULTISPECIES: ABC transporter ATP-binding protein [Rhodoplanes]MDC7786090.1 ABC transporter ATP-binding protein [Rhodoplanes tepidamans]MDC7985636.1 ABC transporter ATP-binding protein [Rhodoplanes sp. TEM]MDQ0357246.1 NitT/TauT family transport system ATP-binding protein [Rhodoplanes tepidamans]